MGYVIQILPPTAPHTGMRYSPDAPLLPEAATGDGPPPSDVPDLQVPEPDIPDQDQDPEPDIPDEQNELPSNENEDESDERAAAEQPSSPLNEQNEEQPIID
jgi:hypothetical protein